MILNIKYKKNPHQEEFHQDDETKFLHMSTGFGGGKSHALCMKAIKLSMINKDLPGGLVCPSFADYKKDILPLMEDILYENRINYYHNRADHYFVFPWSKGKLYVSTAEKKLRGPNWAYALINEATLIPHDRYREVVGRVRIKKSKCSQVASVGTPEGTSHWLYESFIETPMRNSRVIYGDTRDNADNLDEHYIESLEDSFDQRMLDAYLKGLWVNMTGNRFYYAYDPDKHDLNTLNRIDYSLSHIGMDFNVSPLTCTMWHFDGKHLDAYDEICLGDPKGANTHDMAEALKARGYDGENCIIYPDPSGANRSTKGKPDIEILRQHGFYQIEHRRSQPRMRQRQLHMNNLMDKGIIRLNPKVCKGLKKDFSSVEQDPVKLDKVKKNPKLTHYSDGADYLADILIPFRHDRTRSGVVKYR